MKCPNCKSDCQGIEVNFGLIDECCNCLLVEPSDYCEDCADDYRSNIADQVKGDMERGS